MDGVKINPKDVKKYILKFITNQTVLKIDTFFKG